MLSRYFQLTTIPSSAISGHYNWLLVALSYVIAVLASYVALEIAGYLRKPSQKSAPWLFFGGAFAMGAGIFSMHFIGMLAFIMPMQMSYELWLTLLSLAVAIIASGFALSIIKQPQIGISRIILSGIIFGLAIAGMHYTGMAAMIGVHIHYLPGLFFLSILIAIGASLAALWLMLFCDKTTGKKQIFFKIISALVMGAGICGMHYTGMEAAVFTPSAETVASPSFLISPEGLSILIAIIASLIMVIILVASGFRHLIILKLFMGYVVLSPFAIIIGIILIKNIETNKQTSEILQSTIIPRNRALFEMKILANEILEILDDYNLIPKNELSNYSSTIISKINELDKMTNQFIQTLDNNKIQNKSIIETIQELKNKFVSSSKSYIQLLEQNTNPANIKNEISKNKKNFSNFINKITAEEFKLITEILNQYRETAIRDMNISIFLIVGIILSAIGISLFLSFQISKPIIQVRNAAQEIAKGDLTKKVPINTEDEIGQLAISFNQMVEGLTNSKKTMDLLSEMGELLPTCVVQDEIQAIFSQYGAKLLPHLSASLSIYTDSKNNLQVVAVWGDMNLPLESLFIATDCWAIRRGMPFYVPPASSGLRCKHIERAGSYLCTPLSAGGEILGIISVMFGTKEPTHQEQKIISQIAGDVSLALANIRLRTSLQNLSIHDPLTSLYNRRYMEEILLIELNRSKRQSKQLSMIMLDIDHFKKINDHFGHTTGDVVLRELSYFLKQFFRSTDIICRYGGEEFLIILPETEKAFAVEQAEILRNRVKNCSIKIGNEILNLINLSLGVATFPENGTDADAIIKAADTALYRAKEEGRDRVCVAPAKTKE